MIKTVISIKDNLSGFGTIALCDNIAIAKRDFIDLIQLDDSLYNKHYKDFQLCQVGYFDTCTGKLKSDFKNIMLGDEAIIANNKTIADLLESEAKNEVQDTL